MNHRRQSVNFQFEEDPFMEKAQGVAMITHDALVLMKFLQTKPQKENKPIFFSNSYCTIFKNLSDEDGEN